jgi:hypothetical protein
MFRQCRDFAHELHCQSPTLFCLSHLEEALDDDVAKLIPRKFGRVARECGHNTAMFDGNRKDEFRLLTQKIRDMFTSDNVLRDLDDAGQQ